MPEVNEQTSHSILLMPVCLCISLTKTSCLNIRMCAFPFRSSRRWFCCFLWLASNEVGCGNPMTKERVNERARSRAKEGKAIHLVHITQRHKLCFLQEVSHNGHTFFETRYTCWKSRFQNEFICRKCDLCHFEACIPNTTKHRRNQKFNVQHKEIWIGRPSIPTILLRWCDVLLLFSSFNLNCALLDINLLFFLFGSCKSLEKRRQFGAIQFIPRLDQSMFNIKEPSKLCAPTGTSGRAARCV